MKMNMVRHKHKILSMKREVQKLFLNEFWFILIMILFIGFFVLEGFDFGVGIVSRFPGNNDPAKRVYINTSGRYRDGNELWLTTARGAMLAALPPRYAPTFSRFYIPLASTPLPLILRGLCFESRRKVQSQKWKNT